MPLPGRLLKVIPASVCGAAGTEVLATLSVSDIGAAWVRPVQGGDKKSLDILGSWGERPPLRNRRESGGSGARSRSQSLTLRCQAFSFQALDAARYSLNSAPKAS